MNAKNKTKDAETGCDSSRVCLGLTHATAQEVCIAGSFNDWHPSVTPMVRLDDGKWAKELALPPGRYEYRFVVDGKWTEPPQARAYVPNALGGRNAVFEL